MVKQVLAVAARPVLQMIFMTSAWVFTCIASIFQTNVAFAPQGRNKNKRFVGGYVLVPEAPKKGEGTNSCP